MYRSARGILLGAFALSALALQGCALLFPAVPNFRISGVNLNDEFDKRFAHASMGCPNQHKRKFDRAYRGREPRRCRVADHFARVILEESRPGAPARDYLRSKGGRCSELVRGSWRCIVEREVTIGGYLGKDPTRAPERTLITLTVHIHERNGKIQAEVARYDFAPNEKRPSSK